ncbi:MAG: hypothetical protein Fur0034_02500 [Desulfuromonadia bacterium]
MKELSSDHAIVLSVSPFRESDLLARIFTLTHGVIPAVARGGRRSLRRFAGVVESCALLTISLSIRPNGLSTLLEARRNGHGIGLRTHLDRFTIASYFCELTLSFLPEHLPNRRLFRLLWHLVDHLGEGEEVDLPSLKCFGEINLLKVTGYLPTLGELPLPEEIRQKLMGCLATSRLTAITFSPAESAIASTLLQREIATHLERPIRSLESLSIFLK